MQIDIPQDILERIRKRAAVGGGATDAEVIRKALDSLDWHDQERRAVREGIDAWRAGDTQDFDDFDADFRAANGIAPDA